MLFAAFFTALSTSLTMLPKALAILPGNPMKKLTTPETKALMSEVTLVQIPAKKLMILTSIPAVPFMMLPGRLLKKFTTPPMKPLTSETRPPKSG
jgi:hypothetical protein